MDPAHAAKERPFITQVALDKLRRKDPDCAFSHCCALAAGSGTAERNGLAAARTQALEAALESLQGQLGQLEAALSAKGADAADHKAAAAAAGQRAEAAEARVRDFEGEAEQLGSQVASLQVTLPDGSSRDLVPRFWPPGIIARTGGTGARLLTARHLRRRDPCLSV